jgi:hypothetical protein
MGIIIFSGKEDMVLPETWPGIAALIMLTGATVGGAVTALLLLTDKSAPINIDLGMLHGRIGVLGILLLVATIFMGAESNLSIMPAIGTYIITVIGGATLYFLIRRKGILPKLIILAHGSFAIASLAILVFGLPI